ncbi:MAG: response regulator [Gammaproteobacteria bacterium]
MSSILAVDDSASMRKMVSFTLEQAGFDVVQASDGQEALRLAGEKAVDLVLTDVHMPGMDGIELIKALRALPNYRHTPILTLTTESSAEKKAQAKTAGATGWIVKPFTPDKLIGTIKMLLG